jgi:hypothetical protein
MSLFCLQDSFVTSITGVLEGYIYKYNFPLKQVQDQSFDRVCYNFGQVIEIILFDYILQIDTSYRAAHLAVNKIYNYLSLASNSIYDSDYIGELAMEDLVKQTIVNCRLGAVGLEEEMTILFLTFSQQILILALRMAMCIDDDVIVVEGTRLLLRMQKQL